MRRFGYLLLACWPVGIAHAQLYTRLPDTSAPRLDSGEFRRVDTAFARQYVDASKCEVARWPAMYSSVESLRGSLAPYRAALSRNLGVVPVSFAGSHLDSHTIYSDSLYELTYQLFKSRILGVSTMAYVLRPVANSLPPRAVILLHGAGTVPPQSFDLRLAQAGGFVYRPDSSTFIGLGIGLAARGYTVISPFLWGEPPTKATLAWPSVSSLGQLYGKKLGSGGALTLLESQVAATIDFAIANGFGRPGAIAIAGWQEGALLGSLAAVGDPRIGAVVRLAPPIDRTALRTRHFDRLDDAAAFMQIDCGLDERVQSALASPRSFLWLWTNDEVVATSAARYVDTTVVAEVRREAQMFGLAPASVQAINATSRKQSAAAVMADWLDGQLFGGNTVRLAPPHIIAPAGELFPSDVVRDESVEFSGYVGKLGFCPTIDTLFARATTEAPAVPGAPVRAAIREAAGIRAEVPSAISSVTRKELENRLGYRLAQVTITLSDFEVPIVGLLATPLNNSGKHPAVLSFNGNDGVLEGFGYEPIGAVPYLNGNADYLAKQGYVVFVPYFPIWFPNAATSVILTRNPRASTWNVMVPFYEASVSFLRSLALVDTSRIAAYGISFGGVEALVTTSVDDRISALVYSDIPLDQRALFGTGGGGLAQPWWIETCGYIDAAFQAIAPRRFVWEAGEDSIFENAGYNVVQRMRAHYVAAGAPEQFEFVRHGGGHETRPFGFRIFRPTP